MKSMPDQPSYQYDLFVSYADVDRAWVAGFLLPALGLAAERVITERSFRPGAPVVSEFERAVTSSRYTVLVLSPAYLADEWSTFGEQLASYASVAEQRDRLIPLLKEKSELPLRIDFRVRLDCTDKANWESEADRLRALLNQPEPAPERIPCPYPGMVPFSAKDARFFHGREAEIRQMLQHLRHQRYLFVIGPSGSGKSSLSAAGLIPQLGQSSYFPLGFWLAREMRPGAQPLHNLAQAIGGDPAQPSQAIADLVAATPPAKRLLLVVDQFEELFTHAERAEQSRFIAALRALRMLESCALLIAMRADFYADLVNSELWPVEPSQRLEIGPLRGEALRRAIQQPAQDKGVYLEPGLLERLLADAADEPGVLPLIQETMVLLWGEMHRRLLTLGDYERLGGEERSGLAVAMATKADATLAELSTEQKPIAQRIFLRLVQFGEGRPDTRRQQPVTELRTASDDPLMFDQTLRHLSDNRLLTLSGEERGADKKADIAHEALITGWPTLRSWLSVRREAEQTRRRLEAKAAELRRLGELGAGWIRLSWPTQSDGCPAPMPLTWDSTRHCPCSCESVESA
jgi:TIR domain/NACHT domain